MGHRLDEVEDNRYLVRRLNWAGLGVVDVKGKSRCVPVTQVGEQVRVRWHEGPWGRTIGERVDDPYEAEDLLDRLGCKEGLRCSGCTLRHLSEQERQNTQMESHLGAIRRLSGRALDEVELQWVGAVEREGYRERISVQFSDFTQGGDTLWKPSLRARWGSPVALEDCPNHPPELRSLSRAVSQWTSTYASKLGLPIEEETTATLAKISVQGGHHLPPWVTLHLEDPRNANGISSEDRSARLASLHQTLTQLPLDELFTSLLDLSDEISLFGDASLRDQHRSALGIQSLRGAPSSLWSCPSGLSFSVQPPAWLPQSPSTLPLLRSAVFESLWGDGVEPRGALFELGCGVGLISLAALQRSPELSLIGVDLEPMSALCAERSAELNGLAARARFLGMDGRRALAEQTPAPRSMIVHAMRRPLSGLLPLAAERGVSRICYLAPSAPALGRDLAEEPRYQLEQLAFLDQMPGTAQLMTIARLTLRPS